MEFIKKIIKDWKTILIIKIIVYMVFGAIGVWMAYHSQDRFERDNFLKFAQSSSLSIDSNNLPVISDQPADMHSENYQKTKNRLLKIKDTNHDIRFVYIMGLKNDKVIFLVDAEDPNSKDFSSPGTVYEEASENNYRIFEDGIGFTEGPMKDKWGTWVSALVPIKDARNNTVAVLGIDIDADNWNNRVLYSVTTPILLIIILICITLFFSYLEWNKNRYTKFEQQYFSEKSEYLQMIEKSELKFRELFHNSIMGIYRTTPEGQYIEINNTFAKMLGFANPEEMKSEISNIGEQLYIDPEAREELKKFLAKGQVNNYEIQLRRKDGKEIWMSINARMVENYGQRVYDGTCIDITDRKQEEEKKNKLLEMRVRSNKMEALGILAGGIAHDFNNILTAIMGNAELIKTADDLGDIEKYTNKIIESSKRARDIIKQILTFSRKSAQKKEPVNISESLFEALSLCRINSPSYVKIVYPKNVKLEKYVMAEKSSLVQIFLNLIKNAIQSIPSDIGGKVYVEIEEVDGNEVYRSGKTGKIYDRWVKVSIKDEGPGISRLNQGHIFDPYFTTKEQNEGTGLGLSIVHRLITDIDGKISLDSMIGEGTTFDVYLPVNGTGKKENKIKANLVCPDCTLALIDDSEIILESYKILLENDKSGKYIVYTFQDPAEAISFVKQHNNIDIIFSDLAMPDRMDGIMCAKKIKELTDIPTIIMTGYGDRNEVDLAIQEKIITAKIDKPFNVEDIKIIIKRYIEK